MSESPRSGFRPKPKCIPFVISFTSKHLECKLKVKVCIFIFTIFFEKNSLVKVPETFKMVHGHTSTNMYLSWPFSVEHHEPRFKTMPTRVVIDWLCEVRVG